MDTVAAYRNAGELFGYLRLFLGFGELAMLVEKSAARHVRYQWTFKAAKKRYCCEHSVDFIELACTRDLGMLGDHIAKTMKCEHRTATPTEPSEEKR